MLNRHRNTTITLAIVSNYYYGRTKESVEDISFTAEVLTMRFSYI
jgi:hypothetical protein